MPGLEIWNISTKDWIIVFAFISFLIVVINVLSHLWSSKKRLELIIDFDDLRLVSVLTKLSGSGIPYDMNNRIDLYERRLFGRRLLLTTYEVWDANGYSLKVVKSKNCRLDNGYIKQMTELLLPVVTFPGSRMEIVESSE